MYRHLVFKQWYLSVAWNNMKKTSLQSGFTLIETLVAILILALSITALLSLAANGFFTVRYSRNQIVADALVQETIEYLRNRRDSMYIEGLSWEDFVNSLNVDVRGEVFPYDPNNLYGCYKEEGCIVDGYTLDTSIYECEGGPCEPVIFFPEVGVYGYERGKYPFGQVEGYQTSFVRKVRARITDEKRHQMKVDVEIEWKNGNMTRSMTQSVVLTNWRI